MWDAKLTFAQRGKLRVGAEVAQVELAEDYPMVEVVAWMKSAEDQHGASREWL